MSYKTDLLTGKATPEQFMEYVQQYVKTYRLSPSRPPLHYFLGFTDSEYTQFLIGKNSLGNLLAEDVRPGPPTSAKFELIGGTKMSKIQSHLNTGIAIGKTIRDIYYAEGDAKRIPAGYLCQIQDDVPPSRGKHLVVFNDAFGQDVANLYLQEGVDFIRTGEDFILTNVYL